MPLPNEPIYLVEKIVQMNGNFRSYDAVEERRAFATFPLAEVFIRSKVEGLYLKKMREGDTIIIAVSADERQAPYYWYAIHKVKLFFK